MHLVLLPFLKPGYCRVRGVDKSPPNAGPLFVLNAGHNYTRDFVRALLLSDPKSCTRVIVWECPLEPDTGATGGGGAGAASTVRVDTIVAIGARQ